MGRLPISNGGGFFWPEAEVCFQVKWKQKVRGMGEVGGNRNLSGFEAGPEAARDPTGTRAFAGLLGRSQARHVRFASLQGNRRAHQRGRGRLRAYWEEVRPAMSASLPFRRIDAHTNGDEGVPAPPVAALRWSLALCQALRSVGCFALRGDGSGVGLAGGRPLAGPGVDLLRPACGGGERRVIWRFQEGLVFVRTTAMSSLLMRGARGRVGLLGPGLDDDAVLGGGVER